VAIDWTGGEGDIAANACCMFRQIVADWEINVRQFKMMKRPSAG
jgi:hypothetical protein